MSGALVSLVRPPEGRSQLVDLRPGLERGLTVEPGFEAGHYLIEDRAGNRLVDFHRPAGHVAATPDAAANPDAATQPAAPACGERGKPCCTFNSCNSGGCCVAGTCLAVGDNCPLLPAACFGGSCGAICGGRDQPCCGGLCTAPLTSCANNTCKTCGGAGEPCCDGECLPGSGTVCDPREARCVRPVGPDGPARSRDARP